MTDTDIHVHAWHVCILLISHCKMLLALHVIRGSIHTCTYTCTWVHVYVHVCLDMCCNLSYMDIILQEILRTSTRLCQYCQASMESKLCRWNVVLVMLTRLHWMTPERYRKDGRAGSKGGEGHSVHLHVHVHVPFKQALEVACCIFLNNHPGVYFLLGAFYLALLWA